jgi:uncharacterized delta-60 repeat protein
MFLILNERKRGIVNQTKNYIISKVNKLIKKVNFMLKQILCGLLILSFMLFACEMEIKSGKFTCVPGQDSCPTGMKCAKVGIDPNYKCYDESLPECGDSVLHSGEQCDGTDIPDSSELVNKCGVDGFMDDCLENCTIVCGYCGNGIIDATGDEVCDGSNLGGASCEGEGYFPGILECESDCKFDITKCGGFCGDNIIQATEEDCESNDLNNKECEDIAGYFGGDLLSCNLNCTFNTDLCFYCGDGTIDGSEVCDSTNFGGKMCMFGTQICSSELCNISYDDCHDIIQWGTESTEYVYSVALDSNDNIYVTGTTAGTMYGTNFGEMDLFLTKYTSDGSLVWARQWGTSLTETAYGVVVDLNNDIYVTGFTTGSLDGTNIGEYDIFLSKYTSDGSSLWTKQWGTDSWDSGYSVAIDSYNNIYVTGYAGGGFTSDMFLDKYTSDGSLVWTKQWGTFGGDSGVSLTIDMNDNLYVTGGLNMQAMSSNFYLSKYTSDGSLIWNKQWLNGESEASKDVLVDLDGSVYITGSTARSLDGTNMVYTDIFLIKHTADGSLLWVRQWGSDTSEEGNALVIDSYNNIYVTGTTLGVIDGTNLGGNDDIFLSKFTSDGSLVWSKQWGTDQVDYGVDLAITPSNIIYITGYTLGVLGEQSFPGFDFFIIGINTNP